MAAINAPDDQRPNAVVKALVRRKKIGGRADFAASAMARPASTDSRTRCRRWRCMMAPRSTPTGDAPSAIASSIARSAIATSASVAANSASSSESPARSPTQACAASRSTRAPAPTYRASFSSSCRVRRPIRSQPIRQPAQDLAVDRHARRGHRVADRLLQRTSFLRIAGDRRGIGCRLHQSSEPRSRRQSSRLQHNQRGRRPLQDRRHRGHSRVARVAQPHHPAPAGQRQRRRLLREAPNLISVQFRDAERIVDGSRDGAHQGRGTVPYHPRVLAMQQHDPTWPRIAQKRRHALR